MRIGLFGLLMCAAALADTGCAFDGQGAGLSDLDAGGPIDAARPDAPSRPEADAAPPADAGPPVADAAPVPCGPACTLQGGTCADDICTITCGGITPCTEGVVCPEGLSCHVICDGPGTCRGGVECSGAICIVDCKGKDACEGGVECEGASCDITCTGDGACDLGVCCDGGDLGECGARCSDSMGGCCKCGGC